MKGCVNKWRLTFVVFCLNICARLNQEFRDDRMIGVRRRMQGSGSPVVIEVDCIHIRAHLDQVGCHFYVSLPTGAMEGSGAVAVAKL